MLIVEVRNLRKTFSVKHEEAGLRGSFKSIARPEFRQVEAVKGITFSSDIFQGAMRFMMLTVLPAAFVGGVPLNVVRGLDLNGLAGLAVAAAIITIVSGGTFYLGLRRYESGSALNVNV